MQHLSPDQLAKYRVGDLAGAELLAADDHIADCEECRRELDSPPLLESNWAAIADGIRLGAQPETPHASYEQLKAYVDGAATSSEAAQLESHFQECETCRAEAEDLRGFAAGLNVRPMPHRRSRIYLALGSAAAVLAMGAYLFWPHPTETKLAISLRDGASVIGLDQAGHLSAPAGIPDSDRQTLATVLRDRTLPVSRQESLKSNRSILLGPGHDQNTFHVTSPVGEVVLSTTPEFRWQALKGAGSYRVEVFDANYNLVLRSPDLTEASWIPARGLERDKIYAWQVTARGKGWSSRTPQPPDPEARFQVLGMRQAEVLEQARNVTPPSHLLLAIRFAGAGLCRDALAEIGVLDAANPGSPVLAQIRSNVTEQCKLDAGKP